MPDSTQTMGEALPASAVEKSYFAHLAAGAFRIQRCEDCGKAIFYPRAICPHCGSQSLAWFAPSGLGTIYSTTTVRGRDSIRNVCLVDLDEGPRLMSRMVGMESPEVKIGMRVKASIVEEDGSPLLVFERAAS